MTTSYFPYVTLFKDIRNDLSTSSSKFSNRLRRADENNSNYMTIFNRKKNIRMSLIKQISLKISS